MELQIKFLQMLQDIRNDYLTVFFTVITMMAEELYVTFFLAILYWCVDKTKATRIAFIVLFNSALNSVIKGLIKMPRPFQLGVVSPIRAETATGYSFPSGHTQTAVSFWTGIMLVLKTRASILLGSVMILLTAFSRMYLGVHWPMDVAGGIFFGVIFVYFANEMVNEKGEIKNGLVMATGFAAACTLFLNVDGAVYKATVSLWAFCLGAYLEQHYIHFQTRQALGSQLIKVTMGTLGIVIIYLGMSRWLPDAKQVTFVKYALMMLWVTAGAPWLFTKLLKQD